MKYLSLYKKWLRSGELPKNGLCESLGEPADLLLFEPTFDEAMDNGHLFFNWGVSDKDVRASDKICWKAFNPFRQTVVLFLAVMNKEL